MKKQIIVIHGGETFNTYEEYLFYLNNFQIKSAYFTRKKWRNPDYLKKALGNEFEVLSPKMPNMENAKYLEWKIWFEKLFPFFKKEVILLGHSLGGIFLTKYLSENNFPKKIIKTFLVAPPFDSKDADYDLADFVLSESLDKLQKQGGDIYFYHSKDDLIVPFTDLDKYKDKLPNASFTIFEDKGHFIQEEFPEIIEAIKS